MKLQNKNSVLNFGDTSFRRKKYLSEYRELLFLLRKHFNTYSKWEKNDESQSSYYKSVVENTNLFTRTEESTKKLAKRGRTLTNSLVKVGLIDNKRKISQVGNDWLDNQLTKPDSFENILDLSTDNLLFFRQWAKMRLYNSNDSHYINPFLFIVKLLSRYDQIPRKNLIIIVHTISPDYDDEKLNSIIEKYDLVDKGKINFDEFVTNYLENENNNKYDDIKNILSAKVIDQDKFNHYFKNGKSSTSAGPIYLEFVKALIEFKRSMTLDNVKILEKLGKKDKIKKAFGYGKSVFKSNINNSYSVSDFINENEDNILLFGELEDIYKVFKKSKHEDLVREYGDMTVRLTNLSGIISYDNNLVSLPLRPIFSELFNYFNIEMSGKENFIDYDGKYDSDFYNDISFSSIIGISELDVTNLLDNVANKFNLNSITDIKGYVEKHKEKLFEKLVNNKFPKEKVVKLLNLFLNRKSDDLIYEMVTDNAPIADIFEYVLGLSWYYINGKNIDIRHAYNMTLDADFLPLSHAAGYQGDIQLEYNDRTLLLEATLMDKNNQKRGELEPVIRHTVNLSIDNKKETQTIFVASQLDDNVINIFRASKFIELSHSVNKEKTINGVNIFALSIQEIIEILNKQISDDYILNIIDNSFSNANNFVSNGWRDNIINEIMK